MRGLVACGALTVALNGWAVQANAQAPAPEVAAATPFEAASIKRNTSSDFGSSISPAPGGRFVVRNAPLRRIIQVVFGVPPYALQGGPDWLDSTRYDIEAKPAEEVPAARVYPMARLLLAERFKLAVHIETREGAAGYALVLAHYDGRPGDGLRPAPSECNPPDRDIDGFDAVPCNTLIVTPRTIVMRGKTLPEFARALSAPVGRPVADRTGLEGPFDAKVRWAPDPAFDARPSPASDGDGSSLFTALEEQVGLRLQGERTTMEVVVIEHVERPSED